MIFKSEVTINASPESVFDAMADVRNETSWNDKVTKSEMTSSGPVQRGSHFVTVNRGAAYNAVISAYDKPKHLTFEVRGSQMDIDANCEFESLGSNKTLLRQTFDMRPKGFLKLIFPLMKSAVKNDFPKQGARFKAFCESKVHV